MKGTVPVRTRLISAPLPLLLLLGLAGCADFPGPTTGGSLGLVNSWGTLGAELPESVPNDLALDNSGRLFATDPVNGRILVFDFAGQPEGTPWIVPGMSTPDDIAIDGSGNIIVSSRSSPSARVFSPDLELIRSWGTRSGDRPLSGASDIAVGGNGTVYVLENSGIHMYRPDGTYIGPVSHTEVNLSSPTSLAVDQSGTLYVGYQEDTGVGSVVRFSSEGFFISKWVLTGAGGFSLAPTVIAIGPGGGVYIGDSRGIVSRLNFDGSVAQEWGRDANNVSFLSRPHGLAIATDGRLYVSDAVFIGIYTFDSEGELLDHREPPIEEQKINRVKGLAVDQSGFVYTVDEGTGRLQIWSDQGTWLRGWGRAGRRPGYFYFPQDVAVDGGGLIYVADRENGRIQVFDGTGRLVRSWNDPGVASVAVTGSAVYSMNQRELRRYAPNGGTPTRVMGIGKEPFNYLEAVAVDSEGRIYLADGGAGKVHVFSPDLAPLRSIDFVGRRDAFDNIDIAVDSRFRLYVADNLDNLVHIFAEDGAFIRNWSPLEPGRGPTAIAIDPRNDHVYIARTLGPVYEFSDLD